MQLLLLRAAYWQMNLFQVPTAAESRSAGFQPVSNLLYRRFPIGRPPNLRAREMVRTTRRLEALRYGRLETCATTLSTARRPNRIRLLRSHVMFWDSDVQSRHLFCPRHLFDRPA